MTLMTPRLQVAEQKGGDYRSASLQVARSVTSNVGKTGAILLFALLLDDNDDCAVLDQSTWVVSHTATMAQPLP